MPGGNLERPDIQAPVVRWMAWNIGGDVSRNPAVWDKCRLLWTQAGIAHGPWMHCRSMADIDFLISVGAQYGSPFIGLNIEDVAKDFTSHGISLQDIGQRLAGWKNPVHMATLPWVQNGQGWSALKRCVAALEIFPDEQAGIFPNGPDPVVVDQCISHAFTEGLTQVTLMFKTKGYTASSYGRSYSICHSLYTADDITPDAAAWQVWEFNGTCVAPTPPSNGDPVPIDPVPAGAYDDVARLQTTNIKRPDGKDATAFNDQAASLKASRTAVNDHEKRLAAIEKRLGL